jgi:hypothetical protein
VLADLDLWLAARLADEGQQFVVLTAQQEPVDADVVAPAWRFGTPAALHGGTFCYRSALRWTDDLFDLGACAHGPDAAATADRLVTHMRAWLNSGGPAPALQVLPAGTPDGDLPAMLTIADAFTGDGLAWLTTHIPHRSGPRLNPAQLDKARIPFSDEGLATALARYRCLVDRDGLDANQVLADLLHLHHARMIGVDTASERHCLRLARTVAHAARARTAP